MGGMELQTFSNGMPSFSSVWMRDCLSWPCIPFQSSMMRVTFSMVLWMHWFRIAVSRLETAYFGIMCPKAVSLSSAMRVNLAL